MMRSIRWRVAVATALGVVAVGGLGSAAWYSSAAAILRGELDARISAHVRTLATLTRWDDSGLELEFSDELMPDFLPGPNACYFELWRGDDSVLERSRSLGTGDLEHPPRESTEPATWDLVLPDGRAGRAAALAFAVTEGLPDDPAPAPPRVRAVVACSRVELDQRLGALRWAGALVGIALVVASALAVIVLVGIGLRPLRRLGAAVERLDPTALPDALPTGPLPSELEPIRARLDGLIGRVRDALRRERRTAANLAHELRTPLAELQSVTEVAVRWPEDERHRERALQVAHDIAVRMGALTETILQLARSSGGEAAIRRERCDLAALVRDAWRACVGARADAAATLPDELVVQSDPDALRSIVTNLVANAVQHGSGGVRCTLAAVAGSVTLRIANGADGLTAADVAAFGERFWRRDAARTADGVLHAGLGLAIARELCARIGAGLTHELVDAEVVATLTVPPG